MSSNFHLFHCIHWLILISVPAFAGFWTLLHRHFVAAQRALRLAMALLLLADTILYYANLALHGQLTFPGHLPLELCDASLCLTMIALFSLHPLAFDLAYYGALAGASMAMLTPNLWEPFPSFGTIQFFVAHCLTIAGVLYLLWSGQAKPRKRSVLRAWVGVNFFALLVGSFDIFYRTDYMYLRAKPQNASLLDYLGPWPWYLVAAECVALLLFTLLWMPYRKRA